MDVDGSSGSLEELRAQVSAVRTAAENLGSSSDQQTVSAAVTLLSKAREAIENSNLDDAEKNELLEPLARYESLIMAASQAIRLAELNTQVSAVRTAAENLGSSSDQQTVSAAVTLLSKAREAIENSNLDDAEKNELLEPLARYESLIMAASQAIRLAELNTQVSAVRTASSNLDTSSDQQMVSAAMTMLSKAREAIENSNLDDAKKNELLGSLNEAASVISYFQAYLSEQATINARPTQDWSGLTFKRAAAITTRADSLILPVTLNFSDHPSFPNWTRFYTCTGDTCRTSDNQSIASLSTFTQYGYKGLLDTQNGIDLYVATRTQDGNPTQVFTRHAAWLNHSFFSIFKAEVNYPKSQNQFGNYVRYNATVVGDLANSRPISPSGASSATWRGALVGRPYTSVRSQAARLLRGNAEITYNFSTNPTIHANFTDIKYWFGSPLGDYTSSSVEFTDIPVDQSGEFVKQTAVGNVVQSKIRGAIYGDDHSEIAGAFYDREKQILAGFGTKRSP